MPNRKPQFSGPDKRGAGARRLQLPAVIATAAFMLLSGCSPKPADASKPSGSVSNVALSAAQLQHVRFYTVVLSRFHKTVETTGVVDFDNDQATSVLAPFSGPVSRLSVSQGDRVTKGQPLAVVDSPDFAAAISAYRKAVATAQTARRLANMDKDLVQHEGVSRREEEGAQTDAVNAEADRDAALQALVALNVDQAAIQNARRGHSVTRIEGIIRAPIAGTVVERLITPGQLLQAGTTPCFTVANLSRVWVMAQIFDTDLSSIGEGDTVEVETDAGAKGLTGTMTSISAVVNPDTRSVVARVVVDNPQDLLKKQMYVRLRIQSRQESSGLLIPVSAILRDDENLPFVYVVQKDGSFARQHVGVGYRAGDKFEITDGLHAGNQIVIDGAIFVQFLQSQ